MILVMSKRASIYEGTDYQSEYPKPDEQIFKQCDVCGDSICVNNWPDKKSRTPKFKGLVVCVTCDPRPADQRYMKEGYRILHPDRVRIIKMALITKWAASQKCQKYPDELGIGTFVPNCKCVTCVAGQLFPPF